MGLTEPWMVTTESQKNWTEACEREIQARFNWNDKWGWMPGVMAETIDKLKELKEKQIARVQEIEATANKAYIKNPRPLPNSVNHEYGWLATRPDFRLEKFGPFPLTLKVRVDPTMSEIEEEVSAQDLIRAKKTSEKKKMAGLENEMTERAATKEEKFDENPDPGVTSIKGPEKLELGVRPEGHAERAAEDVPPNEIKDPGHVTNGGRKKRYCCCTANCSCLKENRVRQKN